ncbi:MAG: ATP-binding protein, partial [Bacteroidales bacterium]|nr:ATP-binding protein [Bacteroidales bacterium]
MIFKKLYFNIIIRVIAILACCFLLPFANAKYADWLINTNIFAFIIIQTLFLIRRLNFVNRDLLYFFDSIKYDDSSIIINNKSLDEDYNNLTKQLQKVNKQILKLKEQNLQQDYYFKIVTEHASVGLLTYNKQGKISLCNKAFKHLLNIDSLSNISDLNVLNDDFEKILEDIKPSEKKLIQLVSNNKILKIIIYATSLKINNQQLKLISIQDIKNELDEKELESWQRLVKILRHEIMNSIGPISSTIETLNEIIVNPENNSVRTLKQIDNEMLSDIAYGLQIIKERNLGIQTFIDQFRSLSQIPNPNISSFNIQETIQNIKSLWSNELTNKSICFRYNVSDDAKIILGDKHLLQQVIINLLKNSIEAICHKQGVISIHVFLDQNKKINIVITDNGRGINK